MSQRPARSIFDVDTFKGDVFRYMKRHGITKKAMGLRLSGNEMLVQRLFGRRAGEPSLFTTVALADECDLDLNKYIRKKDVE